LNFNSSSRRFLHFGMEERGPLKLKVTPGDGDTRACWITEVKILLIGRLAYHNMTKFTNL